MNPALRMARQEAESSCHSFKVGAVVFRGNSIIARGRNKAKTCPIKTIHKHTINKLHAEMDAIRNLGDINGASIAVVRLDKRDLSLTMARPCADCMSMLRAAGVKKVVYSNFDGEIIMERL